MKDSWKCEACGTLLGVERRPRLHVRYKQLDLMVDGSDFIVTIPCRKCGRLNERRSRREPPQRVAADR